jgi:hypothetical protein
VKHTIELPDSHPCASDISLTFSSPQPIRGAATQSVALNPDASPYQPITPPMVTQTVLTPAQCIATSQATSMTRNVVSTTGSTVDISSTPQVATRSTTFFFTNPSDICGRRRINKKLHLLVKHQNRSEKTWIPSTAIPPDIVAQYLAQDYAKKRRRKSRQRSQFAQS